VVEKVRFDSAFTFLYSKRKGTPAEKMDGQVPDRIKHERLNRILDLTQKITARNNRLLRDKNLEVLVEGISKTHANRLTGRTRTNKIVHFEGGADLIGRLVPVKITKPQSWSLYGEVAYDRAEDRA
jgi:tRNA-2-methylthio-N6-dimethylallyladenosine synthase